MFVSETERHSVTRRTNRCTSSHAPPHLVIKINLKLLFKFNTLELRVPGDMEHVKQQWNNVKEKIPKVELSRESAKLFLIFIMASMCVYVSQRHHLSTIWCKPKPHVGVMDLDVMNAEDLMDYLYWNDPDTPCRIAHDFGGELNNFPHMINAMDGHKKMCMDKQFRPEVNNCVVYSFGINDEWSFDEAVEKMGCQIYAFDPTMKRDDFDKSDNIHFFNMGLSDRDDDKDEGNGWKTRTLKSVYEMLVPKHGRVPIDYVKMDIEMSEWPVIPNLIETGMLEHVKQLAVELHFHYGDISVMYMRSCMSIVRNLEKHGMIRFASRPNYYMNGPVMGKKQHTIFELVWMNSKFMNL